MGEEIGVEDFDFDFDFGFEFEFDFVLVLVLVLDLDFVWGWIESSDWVIISRGWDWSWGSSWISGWISCWDGGWMTMSWDELGSLDFDEDFDDLVDEDFDVLVDDEFVEVEEVEDDFVLDFVWEEFSDFFFDFVGFKIGLNSSVGVLRVAWLKLSKIWSEKIELE